MKRVKKVPDLSRRRREAHKGDFGRVLVLAGSRGMVGAAALTGNAALRAGAGIVTVATPAGTYPILAAQVTCCTTRPLPETAAGTLSDKGLKKIFDLAADFDVAALGPGLGRHASTTRLVHALVAKLEKPLVIDADGLNALAEKPAALEKAKAPRILTPHPGEMARLTGGTTSEVQAARRDVAMRFAKEHNAIVVLKGYGTIVTDGNRYYINATGNPGMASGGTGDVLTGVIAGLLAQRLLPFAAAVLGTYVHGLAGDLASKQKGELSLIATDVLDCLPQAFKRVMR